MTKVLIDCDPGHDDAVAILYAARHLELVALTTTYGNQGIDHTTRNALSICRLAGLDVPVARGSAVPLVAPLIDGGEVHGATGIDGAELPEPDRAPADISAMELIIQTAHRHRGELVLCATGPLTNLALALRWEPRLPQWLKAITIMGGTTGVGNTTPVAEFNILSDPEAAQIVMECGLPLWMVGLNVTRQVGVGPAEIERLLAGGPIARAIGELMAYFRQSLLETHGLATASLHDSCALVPFIAPHFIQYRHVPVEIELASPVTRGMTVCDLRTLQKRTTTIRPSKPPNCRVALAVDGPGLVAHTVDAILALG